MIGTDEYNQLTAQPADHEYALGTSSETNQSQSTMMECNTDDNTDGDTHGAGDGTGGGSSISPYDELCEEIDEEEPVEWSSLPPSPYPPLSFGISGDDEIFEEANVNDIIYGVDNVDIEQSNGKTINNHEVHYIGLYKFVYCLSKQESEQPSETVMPESSKAEDATQ